MDWEKLAPQLSLETPSRIFLLVMDGLGGIPVDGKTALETADTPHLDALAARSSCGLTEPVSMGITPGSGPAHLSLFGYDPFKHLLGRGILEALGVGVAVGPNDIVARGNFATLRGRLITDRRAGRIPSGENELLCAQLNVGLQSIEGAKISLYPGKEHRFVVRFSKEGLSDALTDADPQKDNKPPILTQSSHEEAEQTARIVNEFQKAALDVLAGPDRQHFHRQRNFPSQRFSQSQHRPPARFFQMPVSSDYGPTVQTQAPGSGQLSHVQGARQAARNGTGGCRPHN